MTAAVAYPASHEPALNGKARRVTPGTRREPDRLVEPTIVHALKMWNSSWSLTAPPINAIDERAEPDAATVNHRLARAFRMIARLPSTKERMGWLEAEVVRNDDYALAPDPYRATLMRWWLDLFASAYPNRAAEYSRTGQGSSSL